MRRSPSLCFSLQWSRRRTSTESDELGEVVAEHQRASMEPSTNVDGERFTTAGRTSATRLQWSRRRTSTESSSTCSAVVSACRCFNGAVDERRRRVSSSFAAGLVVGELQWSRRRTSTESSGGCSRGRGSPIASMEPSTNVDGERPAASRPPSTSTSFNGAVDERRRRVARNVCRCRSYVGFNGAVDERRRRAASRGPRVTRPRVASMEPSTNVDGEQKIVGGYVEVVSLQWSRRRTSTESNLSVSSLTINGNGFNGAVDERRRRG